MIGHPACSHRRIARHRARWTPARDVGDARSGHQGAACLCTTDSPDVHSLLAAEDVTLAHGPSCRNLRNLVRNFAVAWRLLRRRRPRVVLSPARVWSCRSRGPGAARRARLYVECGGRVDEPSLSCRLVSPVAHRTYLRWPSSSPTSAGAASTAGCRGSRARRHPAPSTGTFVTVGTSRTYPFDRLVPAPAADRGRRPCRRPARRLHGAARGRSRDRLPRVRRAAWRRSPMPAPS